MWQLACLTRAQRNPMKTQLMTALIATMALFAVSANASIIGVKTIRIENGVGEWLQLSEVVARQTGTGTDVALTTNGAIGTANSDWGNPGGMLRPLDGIAPAPYGDIYHAGFPGAGAFYWVT